MTDIKGYEGFYQINQDATILSLEKHRPDGSMIKQKVLKGKKSRNGYLRVSLCKNSIVKDFLIHRLVAQTFIPNPENKPWVNHKNGIKEDNRLVNLEWSTISENIKHAYNTGLKKAVMSDELRRLTSTAVLDVRTGIFYDSITEVAKAKGINFGTLKSAINRGDKKFGIIRI